jgi:hypothetical protein
MRAKWLALTAVALVTVGATSAFGAVKASSTTSVWVCVNNNNGNARVVAGPGDCRNPEHAVQLATAGGTGFTTTITVSNSAPANGPNADATAHVDCPAGTQLTGGGAAITPLTTDAFGFPSSTGTLSASRPDGNGWTVDYAVNSEAQTVTAYADCAG